MTVAGTAGVQNPPVYFIGDGRSDIGSVTTESVGGKAYHLMRMDACGLPVPPAIVLGTAFCQAYLQGGRKLPEGFDELLTANIRRLENATAKSFGGRRRPLLVSVRSGASLSMPGMLETVLNVGLNDDTVRGLIRMNGQPRLAWDCYRRFVESYAEVVCGVARAGFEHVVRRHLGAEGADSLRDLDSAALRALVDRELGHFEAATGHGFPQDPVTQLRTAVEAVFRSWESLKASAYRQLYHLPERPGTAVTVQAMVFGNAGGSSGAGVGFTRHPASGARELYLDFLFDAQGEDVVGGRRAVREAYRLGQVLPAVSARLERVREQLETEFRDMQDFEFTVENGELFLLQTRAGQRTPWAAVQIAVDLVAEGLIDPPTALARLAPYDLDAITRVRLAAGPRRPPLARAVPASLGVASGAIALDGDRARAFAAAGRSVILVRADIATEDLAGMAAANGILTAAGGRTSHAAVVARQMGKVCLVGCTELHIDLQRRRCRIGEREFGEGEILALDGDAGDVYTERLEVTYERPDAALAQIAAWQRAAAGRAATRQTSTS